MLEVKNILHLIYFWNSLHSLHIFAVSFNFGNSQIVPPNISVKGKMS